MMAKKKPRSRPCEVSKKLSWTLKKIMHLRTSGFPRLDPEAFFLLFLATFDAIFFTSILGTQRSTRGSTSQRGRRSGEMYLKVISAQSLEITV